MEDDPIGFKVLEKAASTLSLNPPLGFTSITNDDRK